MIPTRLLQDLSTAVLGACGVTALFAPEVLLSAISMAQAVPHWPVQLLASAWLSLAMLDWMTRGFTMGGILGRPVLMANFTHYFIAAMVSVRPALGSGRPGPIGVVAIFGVFAFAYAALLFGRTPSASSTT
jgi:hypothetical protein